MLDASYSLGCDTSINSYQWDFGDGTTGQGDTVSHTYSTGSFEITLTVTNSLGNSTSAKKEVAVLPSEVPNLVMHLNFDGSLTDFSGKYNNGAWIGNSSYGPGIIGQGISLDGTSNGSYVLVEHDETLDGMNKLTISAWAKNNPTNASGYIVQKHITYFLADEENRIHSYVTNKDGIAKQLVPTTNATNDTEWHHYAQTYDGSTARIYLDGEELKSEQFSGSVAVNPSRKLYIGKNPWGNSFDGTIDEVRIYDRALTSQEILALYNDTEIGRASCRERV